MGTPTFDAIVIGGGLIGLTTAAAIVEQGLKKVLLVEKGRIGDGLTPHSAGGIRQQFSTPLQVEMARRSLAYWRNAASYFGHRCDYHADGYLMLTANRGVLAELESGGDLQAAHGLPRPRILDRAALKQVADWLAVEDDVRGIFSDGDGRVDPVEALQAAHHHARAVGVDIRLDWPVGAIRRQGEMWIVDGPQSVASERVVIAAGKEGADLVAPFGVSLSVPVSRRFWAFARRPEGMKVPLTIDLDSGFSILHERGRLRMSVGGKNPPASREELLALLGPALMKRAPSLAGLPMEEVVRADLLMNEDGLPYVGEIEPKLWLLLFMGTGQMHGPIAGQEVAASFAGRPLSLDFSPWSPRRRTGGVNSVWWYRQEAGEKAGPAAR